MPDPVTCPGRVGVVLPAGAARSQKADALFAIAKTNMEQARFDLAERALDCADAVLGADADANSQYELVRRRGILDYRRERIPQALGRFECALSLSSAKEDRTARARDLKNVGTALRRLGDFRGALRSLTMSLEMQRADGDVSGAVLTNIGDVYRDLRDPREAMRYYREAVETFRAAGEHTEGAHALESMAELELDTGDVAQANTWLEEALRIYRDSGNRAYQLRVYGGLIRAALADGDLGRAQRWSSAALAVAEEQRDLPLPASLQLQIARAERLSGKPGAAAIRIRDALAHVADPEAERKSLLEEQAAAQEALGDRAAAIGSLRTAYAEGQVLANARHDRQLDWLRARFETAERDRIIATLEVENRAKRAELRQRTLLAGLALAVALAVVFAAWALLLRWRQRERLQEAARRVRHEEELARYKREAEALAEDRSLLQALLDSRDEALCLLDAEGQLLAANRAAGCLLAADEARSNGSSIVEFLGDADRHGLMLALERMEDTQTQQVEFTAADGTALTGRLAPWGRGDGLIVMELSVRSTSEMPEMVHTQVVAASLPVVGDEATEIRMRDDFRRALVDLMLAVVEAWESSSGTSRLELAEKSRIWRVNIDDGRLRARAMERYLAVSKLPQHPRWRDVLRSAYFVLGQCRMELPAREALQRRVDTVLAFTRRDALV